MAPKLESSIVPLMSVDVGDVGEWVSERRRQVPELRPDGGVWAPCWLAAGAAEERVSAHPVLLASASPVLASMLHGPLALPAGKPLFLPNIEPHIARLLVEYIHSDHVNIDSCAVACDLYHAASYLQMSYLETVCIAYLISNLSPQCVLQVYEFAKAYSETDLMQICLKKMSSHASAVLESIGKGKEVPQAQVLERMFALPDLKIHSEMELVYAAERWVLYQLKNPSLLSDAELRNVLSLLRRAVKKIRFLALKPDEFAQHDFSLLLSPAEMLAISMNMLSSKPHIQMPNGFTKSRRSRKIKLGTVMKFNIPASSRKVMRVNNLAYNLYMNYRQNDIFLGCNDCREKYTNKKVQVKILSRQRGCKNFIFQEILCNTHGNGGHAYHKFGSFPWDLVKEPRNGYLRNGSIKMEIKIDPVL